MIWIPHRMHDLWRPATTLSIARAHSHSQSFFFTSMILGLFPSKAIHMSRYAWARITRAYTHIRWLGASCHRCLRQSHPLQRNNAEKLFWWILFDAVDFTLFLILLLLFRMLFCSGTFKSVRVLNFHGVQWFFFMFMNDFLFQIGIVLLFGSFYYFRLKEI